jgi:hypothetical protein
MEILPRGLLLQSADLEALRSGKEGAFERLLSACRAWVGLFSQGLSEDDLEDVVLTALTDVLPDLKRLDLSVEELDRELRRSLNRHRARAKREGLRFQEVPSEGWAESEEEAFILRDHLLNVVAAIEAHIQGSLAGLSERDRDLLIASYGLGPPSTMETVFPSNDARKKALSRARQRFGHRLETSLLEALKADRGAKRVLEDALSILRGSSLQQTLSVLHEFEERSRS